MAKKAKTKTAGELQDFLEDFEANLPPDAHAGHYAARSGDQWDGEEFDFPDGMQTIEGAQWAVEFKGGRFVQAVRVDAAQSLGLDLTALAVQRLTKRRRK